MLGLPGLGLVGTSISMGMDVIQKVTERADGIVGEGMSAVFIGIHGTDDVRNGLGAPECSDVVEALGREALPRNHP